MAAFTLVYRLAGIKVINELNELKLHGNVLTVLLSYYYEEVQITQYFSLTKSVIVTYLALLLHE
jgi:hypothetical protein